jgi:hypothetical protein
VLDTERETLRPPQTDSREREREREIFKSNQNKTFTLEFFN